MVALVLVLIMGDTMNKSLQKPGIRGAARTGIQASVVLGSVIEARQTEKGAKAKGRGAGETDQAESAASGWNNKISTVAETA